MTARFQATEDEYRRATTGAAWRERALRGSLTLRGDDGPEFLQGQVTNDIEALEDGTGCYALLLNHKGKIRADMRVLRAAGGELVVESSRPAADVLAQTIDGHRVGFGFELTDDRERCALISLIGPGAGALLVELGGIEPGDAEHDNEPFAAAGVTALAVRTDLGIDLIASGEQDGLGELRAALTDAAGQPLTADTVETLRVESGRPLLGREIDGDTLPQEAGLNERAVSFEKGCYVGQETVARLFYKGKPNRHLRGLDLAAPAASGDAVTFEGNLVGQVATSAVSPACGAIALAMLRREAEPGSAVNVGDGRIAATVLELPFESHNRN